MGSDGAYAGDPDDCDAFVNTVVRDWRSAPLQPVDRALCGFAAKLTHRQETMTPEDLELLRRSGLDDRAIHDAVQVIGYFNYITRVADALGVEPEDFIEPFGGDEAGAHEPPPPTSSRDS
jgi:uncharacterized peroxidase-related enzyme